MKKNKHPKLKTAKKPRQQSLWKKIIGWLDEHLLLILAGFLFCFIPLYPKIPLFSPIETYIVRVRLEDIFIAMAVPITLIQIWRKKARLNLLMLKLFAGYALIGLLSIVSAMFITKTVPLAPLHLGKTFLHYFRYLEYFSVFFISFAAIKSPKDLYKLLVVITLTVFAIFAYGYMQKFFYWPVYSTMNREFSKGIKLYLTEHARIQSTFAGHYDLGAYLVIILPVIFSLGMSRQSWQKYGLYLVYFLGSWLMVMSASRIPFFAYLVVSYLVIFIFGLQKRGLAAKFKCWTIKTISLSLMNFFLLYYFGSGMLDRLSNVLSTNDNPISLTIILDRAFAHLPIPKSSELYAWLPKDAQIPDQSQPAPTENETLIAQVSAPSDQPPVTTKPNTQSSTPNRPRDVYVDVPEPVTTEVTLPDGTTQSVVLHKERTFSQCALKYELSLCIRLESLWPWAIQSFQLNPILGTGYATLNKQYVTDFTYVDGTDNNYLRTLGETGILGFLSFYGIVIYLLFIMFKSLPKLKNPIHRAVTVGFLSGTIGLLLNAVYIDVFAASKVAYTYWLMAGLIMATYSPSYEKLNSAR